MTEKTVNDFMMPKRDRTTNNEIIIIAPHPDDEIIGCFEVIKNPHNNPIILYSNNISEERKTEALKLKDELINIKLQMFITNIPSHLLDISNKYYFPNPIYETHPDHRRFGFIGENLLRNGYDVTFYSTEMNYHGKFECKDSEGKLKLLNKIYPSQSDLWKYEKKYFLFSAYERWLIY